MPLTTKKTKIQSQFSNESNSVPVIHHRAQAVYEMFVGLEVSGAGDSQPHVQQQQQNADFAKSCESCWRAGMESGRSRHRAVGSRGFSSPLREITSACKVIDKCAKYLSGCVQWLLFPFLLFLLSCHSLRFLFCRFQILCLRKQANCSQSKYLQALLF